jgi:hypothetical protein
MFYTRWVSSRVDFLTVHNLRHILDEAIHNLEGLSCGSPGLVPRETVQPLQNRRDFLLSEDLLYKFDCYALRKVKRQREPTYLIVPA